MKTELSDAFFARYLSKAGLDPDTPYMEAFHFCETRELAESLLALVLEGKKRATASCLSSYEAAGDPLPYVGSYSVITDFDGAPHCVMQTTAVTILPYKDITFDICKREGEDECLETWRRGHFACFTQEGEEYGFTFTEDMDIIFEDFEVVYVE